MKPHFFLLALLLALPPSAPVAGDRAGRYTAVAPVASAAQRDPLAVIVSVHFPSRVTTVHEALTYLLERSGYRLATGSTADPRLPVLLARPLPAVHRNLTHLTLENALRALAGDAFELVVDPAHRLVSFELVPVYRNFTQDPMLATTAGTHTPLGDQIPGEPAARSVQLAHDTASGSDPTNVAPAATLVETMPPFVASAEVLDEAVPPKSFRGAGLTAVVDYLAPDGWQVDLQVANDKRDATVDMTFETTRRQAILDLVSHLDLVANFYPGMRPRPLIVIAEQP